MADGSALSYEYDALGGRPVSPMPKGTPRCFPGARRSLARVSDAGGGELSYLHDEAGRLVALTNENGVQAQFRYDLLDRLGKRPASICRRQRYRYNAADELIAREDADGRETTYAYDRDGRLASIRVPATEHAPALVERYRWLADGRLASAGGADCEVRTRTTRSVTCAWKARYMPTVVYSVEHSHDALGVRQTSRYGDAPPVAWLTYGPGHLHGALVGAVELAFERDALHREVSRRPPRRAG